MGNLRPFQIGLLAVFAIVALISLVVLASYQGVGGLAANPYGSQVVIWGTFEQGAFSDLVQEIGREDRNFQVVQYVGKDPRTFEEELVNAIAEGRTPDAIVLNSEDLVTLRSKLQPISYDSFSLRSLRDQYVDGFELFALHNGLYTVPLFVDPIVMYWNRDIFATGGLAEPPTTWESLTDVVERLTLRDATRNILQATVAFGEYQNVVNAKASLLTLLLQSGSQMIADTETRYVVNINNSLGESSGQPLFSTLQFYIEFNNVNSPLYSWNRTFESDRQAFLGERLALYFGYASEFNRLRAQNPNLNFDITPVPQGAGATVRRTYGKFYGFSLLAAGENQAGTYRALMVLANAANASQLAGSLDVVPAHRASVSQGSTNAASQTAYNQALIARGWLDPGAEESNEAFAQMIEDVVSGRQQIGAATSDTIRRLELAF